VTTAVVAERDLDQEWSEFLEEHRVAMPGTQVLFAFLLVLPFQNRFEKLTDAQVDVYYAALLCAATTAILLIAPTVSHRILWREGDKETLLRWGNLTAIAGAIFLAAGMTLSVYLITDLLFGSPWPALVTTLLATAFATLWFVIPLARRARR
jgi:hypothetical protein